MLDAGRYRLTRRLGQGGMAEVFEAVAEGEAGFRRRVAIKRVLPQLAGDASAARMFLDEARLTSQLHHPGIVAVLDYGTIDGSAFQALEFVDGLDLEQLLRRITERGARLPLALALHITSQVALALDYAHGALDEHGAPLGIVHRDVSPSNVLISWDGHVKLSDFGIALAAGRLERTQGGGVKGKLEYMAPEQVSRGPIDRRTDVFALGCMLHKLLSGESPLHDLTVLADVAAGAELPLDRSLDAPLYAIIERATRKAKEQRYASAGELARALSPMLREHLRGEPTLALQDFLASLRAAGPGASKRGALDALLDVELVLSGSSSTDRARTFSLRTPLPGALARASAPSTTLLAPLDATTPSTTGGGADRSNSPQRSRLPWVAGAGALLVVAVLAWTAWYEAPPAAEQSVPPAPRHAPPAPATPLEPAPAREAQTIDPAAQPSSALTATDAPSAPSSLPRRRASQRAERTTTKRPSPTTPVDEPTLAAGRGTLVIGGDGALRAEIEIDGRSAGYAPKRLDLPTGTHEVVLVQPNGARIGPRRIEITTHHTESAPARWMVPR